MKWKITLSDLDIGIEEETAIIRVLRSKWLTMGSETALFEEEFARKVGARHAIAVNNCTAALHLALLAAGVKPGDEVILPALTFVATANAVLYCGATPVFADVTSTDDLTVNPTDIARKITPRTKVILPVHYAGYAADMTAIKELAARHNLFVIEDAAHAPGASWEGNPVGSIGDVTCFSFFSNKNLATGEGGMLTTDDDNIASQLRLSRSHGMTTVTYDRHTGHAFSYDVVMTGYNYRITEIQAAMGRAQLAKLDRNNAKRRSLTQAYRERLKSYPGLEVPFTNREHESSCHILPILLPVDVDRSAVQSVFKAEGIQTSVHYTPIHHFSMYRDRYPAHVPLVDALAHRLLTLPLHPLMHVSDVDSVSRVLLSVLPKDTINNY